MGEILATDDRRPAKGTGAGNGDDNPSILTDDHHGLVSPPIDPGRREAVDALSQLDLSDMFDQDGPSADSDGVAAPMLIPRVEERHWDVEQAPARLDNGTPNASPS